MRNVFVDTQRLLGKVVLQYKSLSFEQNCNQIQIYPIMESVPYAMVIAKYTFKFFIIVKIVLLFITFYYKFDAMTSLTGVISFRKHWLCR